MRNNSDGNVLQLRTRRLVPSRTAQPLSEPRRRTSSSSSRPSLPSAPASHRAVREPVARRVVSRPAAADDRQSRRAKMTALYEGKPGGREVSTAPPRTQEVPPPSTSMLSMNVVRESLLEYDPSFAALPWEQPSWNQPPPTRSTLHDRPAPSGAPPLTPLSQHQRQTLNELAEVDRRLEMLCGGSPVATRSTPVDRQPAAVPQPSHRQPMVSTTPRLWGVQGHLARQVFDTAGPMHIPPSPIGREPAPHQQHIGQSEPTTGQPVPPLDLELLQDF